MVTKMLNKCFLSTAASQTAARRHQWSIKQVTKSNFSKALEEIKTLIFNSDFISVSIQRTGGFSSPWQKILPIDTAEIAYFKAKRAAERFQVLQFAVCPFSVRDSKLIAYPYNFHLFPRDEFKVGMPSYSFSCQSSYLTSMAQEDFDFNACIHNGITYLSRAQEPAAKVQTGHLSSSDLVQSPLVHSVADSVFIERIKSRVRNWRNACKDSNKTEDALISSLRKLVAGIEVFGSRPSLSIDVCSEGQVQLVLELLKEFADVVPLRVPAKGGGMQVVQIVLTSSEEDKNLLEKELQDMEEEQNKCLRGFREVIDLISTSQKPVVAHNSLNDFAFIYSKFLSALPLTMDEFRSSLLLVFPYILDTNHLMKKYSPFEKLNNIAASISHLKRRFSAPIDMEISNRESDKVNIHGHNVLKICQLFVKLCSILKINPEINEGEGGQLSPSLQCHANIFSPGSNISIDPIPEDIRIWAGHSRRVCIDNLIFLWGFKNGFSAGKLKNLLRDSHDIFSEEFDVRMVDKTCAIIVFWIPGFSESFLRIMGSGEILSSELQDMISEGLKAASYGTYKRACESVLWKSDLSECLDKTLEETKVLLSIANSQQEQPTLMYWNDDEMINLDDL